ncbi:MAG: TetR/AcrR family transcriptional regulator [Rhodobacteraceae bacterium]|nr:TetR/AcrR family transcriptional regulator [Paracoccaceae bacterium]
MAKTSRTSSKQAWGDAFPDAEQVRELKRVAVLRGAAQAFNKYGFHGTSLDDIAESLGVTKPALYHYVKSKQEMLFLVREATLAAAFASLELAEARGGSGRERLISTLRDYIQSINSEDSICVISMEERVLREPFESRIIGIRDDFEARLRDLVEQGIEDGSIVPCCPKLVVFSLLGSVNWTQRWFRHGGAWSNEQVSVAVGEVLERSLSPDPSPRLLADPAKIEIEVAN